MEQYRPRIEDLPVASYLSDLAGRLIRFNEAAVDLWGRRPQLGELALPQIDSTVTRPNGDLRHVQCTSIPICNASGAVTGSLNILVDTTAQRRADAALAENEEMMRSIIDSSPDCMKVLDLEGKLVNMNLRGCHALDIDDFSTWRDRHLQELWPDEAHGLIEEVIQKARNGQTSRFEGRCPTVTGVERWWDITVAPILNASGEPTRILSVSRDITDRHLNEAVLRESNERFGSAFAEAPIGLVLLNSEGRILEANQAFQQMVGYTAEELRGDDSAPITHPDDIAATRNFFASFRQPGAPVMLEKRYLRKDGRIVWGRASVTVRRDHAGKVVHLTAIVEDITLRKEAEQERDRLVQELKRSNAELSTFAHIAAHDLRSPLRMVRSYMSLLQRHLKGALDETSREYIGYVRGGADRMDHLIEGLLKFAQVGNERPELNQLDSADIVASALVNLEPMIEEAQAGINYSGLPVVEGQEMELLQLFQNLLGNALKYRRPGVVPEVRIAAEQAGRFWRFSVSDNGQGIDTKYFEQIFQPLKRLHGAEVQGTGLGLAICQKIVERHGGAIWVESRVGQGSTFYFTLPAKSEKSMATKIA